MQAFARAAMHSMGLQYDEFTQSMYEIACMNVTAINCIYLENRETYNSMFRSRIIYMNEYSAVMS